MKSLNLRVSDQLFDLVLRAVEASNEDSASSWMRESLEAAAYRELAPASRTPRAEVVIHEESESLGFQAVPAGGCRHPAPAIVRGVQFDTCSVCLVPVRGRL